jgi:hypothetical protein
LLEKSRRNHQGKIQDSHRQQNEKDADAEESGNNGLFIAIVFQLPPAHIFLPDSTFLIPDSRRQKSSLSDLFYQFGISSLRTRPSLPVVYLQGRI